MMQAAKAIATGPESQGNERYLTKGRMAQLLETMIVYLRDGADAERVTELVDRLSPTLPFTTVRAPVCRPSWLVEIEALAIVPNDDSRWPRF